MGDKSNVEIAQFTAECFNTREFRATIPYLSEDLEWTEVPKAASSAGRKARWRSTRPGR